MLFSYYPVIVLLYYNIIIQRTKHSLILKNKEMVSKVNFYFAQFC